MNQGFYGFPSNPNIPVGPFSQTILIDRLNSSGAQGPGLGSDGIPYYCALGFIPQSNSKTRNNNLFLTPHWMGRPTLVREMVVGVVTPTTGTNLIFGLFSSNQTSGFPENCLYSSHVANFVASGSFSFFGVSCRIEIPTPGWYWAGVVTETDNAGNIQTASGCPISILPSTSFVANYQSVGLRCGHTYGAMPSSLAARRMTLAETGSGFPMTYLRLSPINLTTTVPSGAPIA